ncbi:MAG: phosphate ABC transporter permease subunit PstC [Rhodobiaceae bacterium]|nr:phosphate ABC transporter permease subunit PstC [Rhodobiaceae bacterium]
MSIINIYMIVLMLLSISSYFYGRNFIKTKTFVSTEKQHSKDTYHGAFISLYLILPSIIFLSLWVIISPNIINELLTIKVISIYGDGLGIDELKILKSQIIALSKGVLSADNLSSEISLISDYYSYIQIISKKIYIAFSCVGSATAFLYARKKIAIRFNARANVEIIIKLIMMLASLIAILTTVGIIVSLVVETIRFFGIINVADFLFGLKWSPQIAMRADQVANEGLFGAIPLFAGTLMITTIAMIVAVPIGLMTAVYLSEYASNVVRSIAKPALEILAGIPTVVYGFFAALTVAPFLRNNGADLGLTLSSESALAAGLVMGIMIIPLISSLSDDVINAVPQSLREGSAALGSTKSETVKKVILPAALPGIVSAILLAVSRAIGETMIVVMAAGVTANLTANPFESVTAVTVQIVVLLVGDQEFDSAKTLAAFALGFTLFIITLGLNILSIYIIRRYREQYD